MKKVFNGAKSLITTKAMEIKSAVMNTSGEGYVDSGVKILMAVVIGALLLGGLYLLFDSTILPTITDKVVDMFNFNGATS